MQQNKDNLLNAYFLDLLEIGYKRGIVSKYDNTYSFNAVKFLNFLIIYSKNSDSIMPLRRHIFDAMQETYKKAFINCCKTYKSYSVEYYQKSDNEYQNFMRKLKNKVDKGLIYFSYHKLYKMELQLKNTSLDIFLKVIIYEIQLIAEKDSYSYVDLSAKDVSAFIILGYENG